MVDDTLTLSLKIKELEEKVVKQSSLIDELKWNRDKAYNDLRECEKQSAVYVEERDSAFCERNEARECEQIFQKLSEEKEVTIKRLTTKLEYCYNKAYILQHTENLSQCKIDVEKLWWAVEEFKPTK